MVVQLPPEHERERPEHEHEHPPTEAGVIDDARARHRRERWAGAIVATLAVTAGLVFGLGGGGSGSASRAPHDGGRPAGAARQPSSRLSGVGPRHGSVLSFGLLSAGTGWVATSSNLYLTNDDGSSWRQLNDSRSQSISSRLAITAIPSDRVLAAELGVSSSSPHFVAISYLRERRPDRHACRASSVPGQVGVLALSADAGQTWSTRLLPGCQLAQSLSFVNANVGYAAFTSSMRASVLQRTLNGGASWRIVSRLPAPVSISFGSRSDGLAIVTMNYVRDTGAVYSTADGGRTWKRSHICGPTAVPTYTVYCGQPFSFGSRGVVLAVGQNLARHRSISGFVYTTADDGRHWIRHRVPPLGSPEMPLFSAPDAHDLFVYSLNGVLYRSTDAGDRWTAIREPLFKDVYELQFANAHDGWILSAGHFEYTDDGGHSWKAL